jgi:hypothetical protein
VAREAATQTFDPAARALNIDWGRNLDGKQIQRWAQRLGGRLVEKREAEADAYEQGERPAGPPTDPLLLVVGMDGGRWQSRLKNPESGSRWREDKVLTITSYMPGDGLDRPPEPLVSTYVATTQDCHHFGRLARVEAERRGIRQAARVLHISDGGNWIDPVHQEHFGRHLRIIDYYHAVEHLHDVGRAVYGQQEARGKRLGQDLERLLWRGQVAGVLRVLDGWARKLGAPQGGDGPDHPRRLVAQNLGYFQKHQEHMNYPEYRKRGWLIGSGNTEAGVKQVNKRVKGTEQFWLDSGAEPILELRALWSSQDQRWDHYWLCGRFEAKAA